MLTGMYGVIEEEIIEKTKCQCPNTHILFKSYPHHNFPKYVHRRECLFLFIVDSPFCSTCIETFMNYVSIKTHKDLDKGMILYIEDQAIWNKMLRTRFILPCLIHSSINGVWTFHQRLQHKVAWVPVI